jgi:hypothetical protein
MTAYGPLLVTVMGSYIHSISPLPEIFYQRQVMCCNIHGPENIALTLKYVHESSPTNKVKQLPFIRPVTYRYLPFVPQAPDGCELSGPYVLPGPKTQRSAERRHLAQLYSCMICPQLGEILEALQLKALPLMRVEVR